MVTVSKRFTDHDNIDPQYIDISVEEGSLGKVTMQFYNACEDITPDEARGIADALTAAADSIEVGRIEFAPDAEYTYYDALHLPPGAVVYRVRDGKAEITGPYDKGVWSTVLSSTAGELLARGVKISKSQAIKTVEGWVA